MKEQIEELIQRGKLQKFVKKDYQSHPRMEEKSNDNHKEDKRECPKQAIGEIRVINGGLVTGGSYRSLRKALQRQVNSVHVKHPVAKHRSLGDEDIIFSLDHMMTRLLLSQRSKGTILRGSWLAMEAWQM